VDRLYLKTNVLSMTPTYLTLSQHSVNHC